MFHYLNSSGVNEWFIQLKLLDLFCLMTDELADTGTLSSFFACQHEDMYQEHIVYYIILREHIFNFLLNTNWVYFPILYQVTKLHQLCERNHRAALTDTIFLVLHLVKVEVDFLFKETNLIIASDFSRIMVWYWTVTFFVDRWERKC